MNGPQHAEPSKLRFMLRALRYRNYRLYFGGQIVSLIGTWLTMIASNWLVYRLAGAGDQSQPLMLGIVGFAGQIPIFLMTPLAGVWVDRWNKHTILIVTQSLSMLQSFALAVLALSDVITIPQQIALNMFQGIVNSLDVPARQAFTVEIVEVREDLSNAIALNSSMVHAARLIGPAVGGFLIYTVGEGFCFLIDGLSYLGVIAALAAMRLRPAEPPANRLRAWASLWEGLRYAATSRPIRTLLMMVAVTSATAMSLTTLMPIFAGQVLGGDELTLGWLLGASGAGALVGTVYLASRASVLGLGRVIATASAMLGVGLMLFSFSRSLVISLPLLMLTSFSLVTQMASCNTVLQTIVDDDKRGRVMALYAMAFLGVAPLGSLLVGALAAWTGAPWTVFAAGLLSIATALVFASQLAALRPLIRPIYQTKGILPTVASALESTTGLESRTRE